MTTLRLTGITRTLLVNQRPGTALLNSCYQNSTIAASAAKYSQQTSTPLSVVAPSASVSWIRFHSSDSSAPKVAAQFSTIPPDANIKKTHEVENEISATIKDFKAGTFSTVKNPEELKHFRTAASPAKIRHDQLEKKEPEIGTNALPHPIWSEDETHSVEITHKPPIGIIDRVAFLSVKTLRGTFDLLSGFDRKPRNENMWLNRIIFLETVAGVPGMVAAMVRHLNSLRKMSRDHGWIHTLLEEAENERMHLMTAMQLKQPSVLFRTAVMGAQGVFVSFFSLAYLVCPKYCHRFVGYLEEEAVVTYTKCLKDIESGPLHHWETQEAPFVARNYWNLRPDATMLDVILAIRADEAHHRLVNHTLASMKPDEYNPYKPGS